jgi:pSer/pThr/pTyr-binding forkhead associated (FHA) protein
VLKSSYPALYDPENKRLHTLLGSASFVVGRSETADLTVLDLSCSRQHFRIIRVNAQHYVDSGPIRDRLRKSPGIDQFPEL